MTLGDAPDLDDGVVALRPWRTSDVATLVAACNGDETLARWLDALPQPYTERDARAYVEFGERGWRGESPEATLAIVDAASGDVLGSIGIRPRADGRTAELGYWTSAAARGHGAASRATRLVSEWLLRDARLERIEVRADPRNEASVRVAEKAGFTREGVLRAVHVDRRTGERVDHVVLSLLRDDLGG